MILLSISALLWLCATLCDAVNLTGYEYIVVGSGAGGGPLAARLALAGHRTLLIEAGTDHGSSVNYSVPGYSAIASEVPSMSWNFFVRHYADDAQQARDFKATYTTPGGGDYTGLNPPSGSTLKGVLYPRAAALGGCTAHNALIAIYPHRSDFSQIAALTGDASWNPDNMRQYFVRLEKNRYLLPLLAAGHGFDGWLSTEITPLTLALEDPQVLSLVLGGATAAGLLGTVGNLVTVLAGDANADTAARDQGGAYYQVPISTNDAKRNGAREFVLSVRDAVNTDGSKKYPLDVRMNCFVTRVIFDTSSPGPPRATGVEFLDGPHLYRASPLSESSTPGTPGTATASREVIVSGGTYNSPQLLKLSGIGPAAELAQFGIPLVVDLPGVGTNLQDHYEISVQGRIPSNFSILDGCTFSFFGQPDPCLERWRTSELLTKRGIYGSGGLPVALYRNSSVSEDGDYDTFIFGGPVNFRGYFPGYSVNATIEHDVFTWAILKAHPRNSAGTVKLRSADPLDVPEIIFNSFNGSGAAADLQALYEAVGVARSAFAGQLDPVSEVLPGADVTSRDAIETYARDVVWGHHASSTCPIGAEDDPLAVLDSSFRVRGVSGLRVVDASVYPRIPGVFTAVSTYMVAEKAADVILAQLAVQP
ncbi:alcohol oxidase [Auricularia subglabra TFB-10046 SS5]|nr:alcohol oxidase [Auricularia subglabra TFB-10046 SS5]